MGLNCVLLKLLDQQIYLIGGWTNSKMAELGNQHIHEPKEFRNSLNIQTKTGKEYFESKGVTHISFDKNGKDGALKVDLTEPLHIKWEEYFDIVTNCGTSEHVLNQHQVFETIHNICRVGGLILHSLPLDGYWKRHCSYHYTEFFGLELCNRNDYELITSFIQIRKRQKLLNILLRKKSAEPFQQKETFGSGIV